MIFLSLFGIGSFINGEKARYFIYLFFFGMRFSGVILSLVPPFEPVSPVAANKVDRSLRCLRTSIYSGSGASDCVIMFGPFFHFLYWHIFLSNSTINVVYSSVS